jgi:hypothetical protein
MLSLFDPVLGLYVTLVELRHHFVEAKQTPKREVTPHWRLRNIFFTCKLFDVVQNAISLQTCYRPSRIVTSFYRGKEADSKKGSNSSLKTCTTVSSCTFFDVVQNAISLRYCYRPSRIVTSFYRDKKADSKKGSNSSLKTCATRSSLLLLLTENLREWAFYTSPPEK